MINKDNFIDMTGMKFGYWTVLYRVNNTCNGQAVWHCRCDCGTEKDVKGENIRNGSSKSCGCSKRLHNKWDLLGDYGIGYDNNGEYFYFDIDDYNLIKDYYWRVKKNGYVTTSIYNRDTKTVKETQLHRLIMNPLPTQEIDHINHHTFDNRKENLRIVSTSQNQMNTMISTRNTSGVKGVYWDKDMNKWRVRITVDGKRISLGFYSNINEAAKVRKEAEIKYYGRYRYKDDKISD